MRVTFLGTGGAVPTTERNPSAVLLQRAGDRFLFDVGEGTQRQMMRFSTGFDVDAIFLTHIHGDHVLGLPGFVHTVDFNDRDAPLDVYTSHGTTAEVEELATILGGRPGFPIRVHGVDPGDTVVERDEYEIRTFETNHRTRSVGYALIEDDRTGRFDREAAAELGVPEGPKFGQLQEGAPVELDDGTVVRPDQVVGPPRPGRRVVYTGDTRPTETTAAVAANADLLVHDAMFASDHADRARETGHSTAAEAATVAARAGATRLALTHISSRYGGDASRLHAEARETFEGTTLLPDDGDAVDVPYPE